MWLPWLCITMQFKAHQSQLRMNSPTCLTCWQQIDLEWARNWNVCALEVGSKNVLHHLMAILFLWRSCTRNLNKDGNGFCFFSRDGTRDFFLFHGTGTGCQFILRDGTGTGLPNRRDGSGLLNIYGTGRDSHVRIFFRAVLTWILTILISALFILNIILFY